MDEREERTLREMYRSRIMSMEQIRAMEDRRTK